MYKSLGTNVLLPLHTNTQKHTYKSELGELQVEPWL